MSGVSGTERLRALIRAAQDAHGWSYAEIARRSKTLSKSGVHQIATKTERADLLGRDQLEALARGIGVPADVVIQAALEDAGLVVISDDSVLPEARILTEATRDLTEEQRSRWLAMALELSKAYRKE